MLGSQPLGWLGCPLPLYLCLQKDTPSYSPDHACLSIIKEVVFSHKGLVKEANSE